ncbi:MULTISPECIES: restriction endonuclease subunit S [Bacteroidaceae]|uniref:restriction endonuclease subunit S n=1 Tax=Bacteroidaceae TaxID=815 RepID=UPI001CE1EFE4|nr:MULTISPECIES: restriction endonuclease subunit S [Bacteroidaceae]MCA5599781.1 restriction endonuclease subunit S [Bacteroides fragilis]
MADNNENKVLNVPHLRFPEFSGEWKKHSLGEIGETIIGLTYKPSDVVDNNGIIVFRSSNIKNGMIDYSDLVRVNKHIKDKIITKENDILVCARNGSQRLIGKNAIIKQEDANNTFGAFMMVYRANDNPFILPLLSTKKYFSQVGENLGARINQITTSDFNGFEFYFPENHAERTKIAELFRLLDERIATQNKIIEDLKKLKSAITDLLFHSIADAHTIRLGEIAHITNGAGDVQDANTEHQEDWYPFFDRSEELKWFPTYSFDKEAVIYAGEGQSFYPRYYNGKFALHQRCYAITDFASCIIPKYCYHFMNTLNSYFVRNSVGSTVPSLRMDIFQKVEIRLPPIPKQQHICKIIDAFYTKLEVEQRGISILQELKQFLLSQMFI